MKLASFNINNINRRLTNLVSWLRETEPDIVCVQELKCGDTDFPAEAIRQAGYRAVYRGERSWNGVAILARWGPVVTRMDLPGDAPTANAAILRRRLTAGSSIDLRPQWKPSARPQI
jgi:exodeoxyribonuclease III